MWGMCGWLSQGDERWEDLCLFVYIHKYVQVRACVCSFVSVVGECTCFLFLIVERASELQFARTAFMCMSYEWNHA